MSRATVQAVAFVLATALLGMAVVTLFQEGTPADRTYRAVFTEVSGLKPGEEVKASGVSVGTVGAVRVRPDNTVEVEFDVTDVVPMTEGTRLTVRYKNLVGDRYLALTEGRAGAPPLPPGAELPPANTAPALDLDELFNGFSPLFEGLQPEQVNQLAGSLVAVLQGEGDDIDGLLRQVGSLTGSLADRDEVIGRLVTNLDTVLGTLDKNGQQLDALVVNLQRVVAGLSADRERIGRSLEGIDRLTTSVSDLLHDTRPGIAGTVEQVDRLATVVDADAAEVERLLSELPGYYQKLGRVGAYGGAFQFYLCGARLRITPTVGPVVESPFVSSEVSRCQF